MQSFFVGEELLVRRKKCRLTVEIRITDHTYIFLIRQGLCSRLKALTLVVGIILNAVGQGPIVPSTIVKYVVRSVSSRFIRRCGAFLCGTKCIAEREAFRWGVS